MEATQETKPLISFHGDPAVKEKYLARVRAHATADELIKGTYWQDGKGCAVGCTVHSDDHRAYENELGIPSWLAHLEDSIFEALPNGEAKTWPADFLQAIPVGKDLEPVKRRFLVWLLIDETDGLFNKTEDPKIKEYVGVIGRLLEKEITGELSAAEIAEGDQAARDAEAARAARDARAARAAWDARDARAARAAWDAWDARAAWDAWADWDAWAKKSAEKLLILLRAAQESK